MRLLNVEAILDLEQGKVGLEAKLSTEIVGVELAKTRYAVLSHCWGAPSEEVHFADVEDLAKMHVAVRYEVQKRSGYQKILNCCKQACRDNLQWVWVDTCCIDKRSSAELSEAINSMCQWYAKSERCYVYFQDVDGSVFPTKPDRVKCPHFSGWPKWFSRSWTLQELVAPRTVDFFNNKWEYIGNKRNLSEILTRITRVPTCILEDGLSLWRPSVAQIMSWAADRTATRVEDRAYSLLGLLGVYIPILYGEEHNAFRRLQLEVIRTSNDHTILAWGWSRDAGWTSSFLAESPSDFQDCHNIVRMTRDEFVDALKEDVPENEALDIPQHALRNFMITNSGIEICLPLKPCRGSTWLFEVAFPCRQADSSRPIIFTSARLESNYVRYFRSCDNPSYPKAQFQQLFLPYGKEIHLDFTFELDRRSLFRDGFYLRSVVPNDARLADDSLVLSRSNDCAVILYNRSKDNTSFALVFRYCFGEHSVHILCSKSIQNSEEYAWELYRRIRKEGLDEAHHLAGEWQTAVSGIRSTGICLAKHVHFPHSIRVVRVIYRRLPQPQNGCAVSVDTSQCTGCCTPTWKEIRGLTVGLDTPGPMTNAIPSKTTYPVYELFVDASNVRFLLDVTYAEGMELGDYGRLQKDGRFKYEGNIFKVAAALGMDTLLDPVKHAIRPRDSSNTQGDFLKAASRDVALVLRNATGYSLRNDQHVISVLKALSAHLPPSSLAGRCLVTTVVQCSECYCLEGQSSTSAEPWPKRTSYNSILEQFGGWTKVDNGSPFYTVATPLAWRLVEPADWTVRRQFSEIRHCFYMLLGLVEDLDDPSKEVEAESVIKFLAEIFAGVHFSDLMSDPAFFKEIPIKVTKKASGAFYTGTDRDTVPVVLCDTLISRHGGDKIRDPHDDILAKKLLDGIEVSGSSPASLFSLGMKTTRDVGEPKPKTFGAEVLRIIRAIYQDSLEVSFLDKTFEDKVPGGTEGDRETIRSLIQEVKALHVTLSAVDNDDERRSLEEDVTGKILLVCWRDVRLEVKRLLEKVVDNVVNDKRIHLQARERRARRLQDIFADASNRQPHGGQSPLWRVMADAEAGISKHRLFRIDIAGRNAKQNDHCEGTRQRDSVISIDSSCSET